MATPANLEVLVEEGMPGAALDGASASDLLLAVRGTDDDAIEPGPGGRRTTRCSASGRRRPPTGTEPPSLEISTTAVRELPGANVAIISVPGPFAALEAHKALRAGLDVLLFSDNVPLDDEIELKEHAARASGTW